MITHNVITGFMQSGKSGKIIAKSLKVGKLGEFEKKKCVWSRKVRDFFVQIFEMKAKNSVIEL